MDKTVVLVDETRLRQGVLNEVGVKNIQALEKLATSQTVSYDFEFYQTELPVDMPMIVVSKGCKSILPAECRVRVCSNEMGDPTPDMIPEKHIMDKIRIALALLSMQHEQGFDILPQASESIERHFVSLRQSHRTSTADVDPVDELHNLLSLARVFSRSHGETILGVDRWKAVLELESNRAARHL